jgi:hypothetical protein
VDSNGFGFVGFRSTFYQVGDAMANLLAANPWTLDTPALIADYHVKINNIEFVNYTASTDKIVLQDRDGNNLWDATGTTSNAVVRSGHIGWVNGLRLVSITGPGLVKVYFE